MARLLIYDERLFGDPPWEDAHATCLVNEKHSMTSIVTWIKSKTKKYKGQDTVYIMAHGNDGWIELGRDGLDSSNVHHWAPLEWKLDRIIILACSVAKSNKGYWFLSQLAWYTSSWVTAASTNQKYIALPFGLGSATFGKWEGKVHTWGPDGQWAGSFTEF